MAKNTVWLRVDAPTIHVELTPELQEIWNQIQFYDAAGQYREYDEEWDKFLNRAYDQIVDQIMDFDVTDADEVRGG